MKKVININFQGRVIPIEESAYEMLQQYIASLRNYFDKEEGRDEIINDIENRIAELFGETLKKGAACITDEHLQKVMDSMGRPQDFDDNTPSTADAQGGADSFSTSSQGYTAGQQASEQAYAGDQPGYQGKKRLYRDEQDKILGGVASGLANYLNLDPAVIRILFALLAIFGGSGFLVYIVLWIVLPSRSLVTNIRKRLYRDADDRVIAGVCGGLAKYFDMNPAIPRVIFAAPFIFGIITSIGRHFFDPGPVFVGGFGGGTFILVYIILWIVLPEALTAAEKLEMRGEKIDVNTIRDTVMSDMQGFKGRAQKMGEEFSASAQRLGSEVKEGFQQQSTQVGQDLRYAGRRTGRGVGNAFAILVKAFVYFIGGCIAFGLFVGFIALMGAGVGVLPLRDFLLEGTTQNALAWGTLFLFLGVPIISLLVWFIRRLMGARTNNKFIGFGFTAAWLVGLFCFIGLLGSLNRSFRSHVNIKEDYALTQPTGTLQLKVADSNFEYYDGWVQLDGLLSVDGDSLLLNTVRVEVARSKDSLYHLYIIKQSKGRDRQQSERLIEKISFPISQNGNTVYLPENFSISQNEKWRNQRIVVVVEVPVGKQIKLDDRIRDYEYFSVEMGSRNWRRGGWDRDFDIDWNYNNPNWQYESEMKMTEDGLDWEKEKKAEEGDPAAATPADAQPLNSEKAGGQQPDSSTTAPATDSLKKIKSTTDTVYRYNQARIADKLQPGLAQKSATRRADSPLASIARMF